MTEEVVTTLLDTTRTIKKVIYILCPKVVHQSINKALISTETIKNNSKQHKIEHQNIYFRVRPSKPLNRWEKNNGNWPIWNRLRGQWYDFSWTLKNSRGETMSTVFWCKLWFFPEGSNRSCERTEAYGASTPSSPFPGPKETGTQRKKWIPSLLTVWIQFGETDYPLWIYVVKQVHS